MRIRPPLAVAIAVEVTVCADSMDSGRILLDAKSDFSGTPQYRWTVSGGRLNGNGPSKSTIQSARADREGTAAGKALRHRHTYHSSAATQIDQSADNQADVAADPKASPVTLTTALSKVTSGGPVSFIAKLACSSESVRALSCSFQPE